VGASLYLLVRLADVSPKSFICPSSDQQEFSGKNPNNLDIVDLWDFGASKNFSSFNATTMNDEGPAKCVSYAYHQPYMGTSSTGQAGKFRADDQRSAAFALMADKNPWYDSKLSEVGYNGTNLTSCVASLGKTWDDSWNPTSGTRRDSFMAANAQAHEREGQNVLFADGHCSFEKLSDVGVKNDNIYTPQLATINAAQPVGWRVGINPITPDRSGTDEVPQRLDDSMLVNDYEGAVR
jgi:prepilin-type processing-associated H-X9-DG protein